MEQAAIVVLRCSPCNKHCGTVRSVKSWIKPLCSYRKPFQGWVMAFVTYTGLRGANSSPKKKLY